MKDFGYYLWANTIRDDNNAVDGVELRIYAENKAWLSVKKKKLFKSKLLPGRSKERVCSSVSVLTHACETRSNTKAKSERPVLTEEYTRTGICGPVLENEVCRRRT